MKNLFAISNIAWDKHDDPAVLQLLKKYGIDAIEVTPTKIWSDLVGVTDQDLQNYRNFLKDQGFVVPAFQAILFGHPELQVFDTSTHQAFFNHLELIARLASGLGAETLVFGAPKNRKRNGLASTEAFKRAAEFFHQAGEKVQRFGCVLGIEANPVEYQCDFMTNTADAQALVRAADSPGTALHFDSGATAMTKEDVSQVLKACTLPLTHYHISEPMLGNPADGIVDHVSAFKTLKEMGYARAVSIEMKMQSPELEQLEAALRKITGALNDANF